MIDGTERTDKVDAFSNLLNALAWQTYQKIDPNICRLVACFPQVLYCLLKFFIGCFSPCMDLSYFIGRLQTKPYGFKSCLKQQLSNFLGHTAYMQTIGSMKITGTSAFNDSFKERNELFPGPAQ